MAVKAQSQPTKSRNRPLFEGSDWDFRTMQRTYDAIREIALEDLGLDVYANQIEIISSEQMLDAYCSIGMPLMYQHWSFGKRFAVEEEMYRKGHMGLAYEIVINSSPCISYYMEENTMAIQALVIAHAAFGHNHFFKNNYLFQQWTDAEGILDYLNFAKRYIARCEERHGLSAVEEILDAAHALMDQSVFRYRRHPKPNLRLQEERERERREFHERHYNDLWRTLPKGKSAAPSEVSDVELLARKKRLKLPEENLLYFIEKISPSLDPWQREILRIVRNIAQYFYPQKQTKMMNEGCATFVHHYIVNRLYDDGLITEGTLLEILHNHSNVVFQPGFDDPRFSGINPYALGFAMMQDIRRIVTEPTAEDRDWFPAIAGTGDWRAVLRDAWANYRDESFIRQFLSPRLMREMKLFKLTDKSEDSHVTISDIHDERGYRKVRDALADSYDVAGNEPDIQIVDVDLKGDRELVLQQTVRHGIQLAEQGRDDVLDYIRRLWGYAVRLQGVDEKTGETVYENRLPAPDKPGKDRDS
ncbi:MAG TPA: SpoVR family protein [Alphaproteobacteria bacterium]|jgi:spore cortex formation protein SpoVR/YcgB (stage V sporulation)|nr:SpoVR family protein [Alphaproteobacteria bacterium]